MRLDASDLSAAALTRTSQEAEGSMSLRKLLIASALTLAVSIGVPAKASADWLFTPYIGMNWGGTAGFTDAIGDFEDEFERRSNFGASLAWMGAGAVGFEVDFGYSPNFFQNTTGASDFQWGDSNVTTLMANLTVGAPIGGQSGIGIRPYASGGVGLIRSRISDVTISSTRAATTSASTLAEAWQASSPTTSVFVATSATSVRCRTMRQTAMSTSRLARSVSGVERSA